MRAESFLWFVRGMWLAFGAAVTVGLVYGVLLSARVLVLVFIALLLASGLEPLIDRLRSRGILGRGATLLLVYASFFGLVVVVALLIIPSAVNQFAELGTRITPLLMSAREWAQTVEPRALSVSLTGLIDTLRPSPTPYILGALGRSLPPTESQRQNKANDASTRSASSRPTPAR